MEKMNPPLRWIGGKHRISRQLIELLPTKFNNYIEPMVGSAALFFAYKPLKAILADKNEEIINFYSILVQETDEFISKLLKLKASKNTYYKLRSMKPKDNFNRALRFVYLNRLCWNGVYRVNKEGAFNVPIGNRLPKTLWKKDHLEVCASLLKKVKLLSGDFENIVKYCREDDFVYFDPPYPKGAKHGLGFNRYSPDRFKICDHKRLAILLDKLDKMGINILLSISDDDSLISIYPKQFRATKIKSSSLISCKGNKRGRVYEVILRNYF